MKKTLSELDLGTLVRLKQQVDDELLRRRCDFDQEELERKEALT